MCRCRPTKVVQAYQCCHVKSRFTVGPLMTIIFPKNEIPHKLHCDIFQDGGWTSHKNQKMMFQG